MVKSIGFILGSLLLAGCSTVGVIKNEQKAEAPSEQSYSLAEVTAARSNGDMGLVLAFSGGGTRAAALAYGVLQELRDTQVMADGRQRRMLDEIDAISSVSGGSFTSAYYGLYGDAIFEDFEAVFLKRDIQSQLVRGLFNPLRWFGTVGRTEMAIDLYEREIFHGKTFGDMRTKGGPLILINASDLVYGVRFSFVQGYFNFLCSDLGSFSVARAVAASSAVPVLFDPVVVQNYPGCEAANERVMRLFENAARGNPEIDEVIDGLMTYKEKERRVYAHFVDGGITDNLGLRAIYEAFEATGGVKAYMQRYGHTPPRRLVVISIDASTSPESDMEGSANRPSLKEIVDSISSVQLHRYNSATLELMDRTIKKWARELSSPQHPVEPYFVKIGFRDIEQAEMRAYFDGIPTSFRLTDEQVENLITAGRELLRSNPEFQRLLAGTRGDMGAAR